MQSSLKDNFCSSPWFHLRIDPAGYYLPCRWGTDWGTANVNTKYHISTTSLNEYMNSVFMKSIRSDLLNGKKLDICSACYYEDEHNKVSGRQKQLLKSAIRIDNFTKTFCASPHWDKFSTELVDSPVDLQIDIGNTCNSACIMCNPRYSSRLASDYKKLVAIEPALFNAPTEFKNWTDDPNLADKFINELAEISNLRYIHLLGGETLYLKSFYDICNRLIDKGLAKNISLGITTNATLYTPEIEQVISEFKNVYLGVSIESVTTLNNYVRYPSQIDQILSNIDSYLELDNVHISLRITPSVLTIYHIDSLFRYMLDQKIIAESCNILYDPSCLRIELLPEYLRQEVIDKIQVIVDEYNLIKTETIINRRRSDLNESVIASIILEYLNFLKTYQTPYNIEQERLNLVKFIQAFETIRNNKILDYLPEYEEFLRSSGY